jgi:dipeptidase D
MANALKGLKPEKVWHYFEEICSHPHPSKHEEKLAAYIVEWAKEKKFDVKTDKLGNIAIRKPATPGMENRKGVVIQGHIDMVCEKNSDVEFDFDNQGIQAYVDGDWVKAKGTTLGADNGIGVAMGMALLDSTDIAHPELELLCTLDEETGLTGAIQLATDLIHGEILLNLDSEEDGTFTIGCAGGINTAGHFEYKAEAFPADYSAFKLTVKGLKGGHSGIEINDGRANAAKLINRAIYNVSDMFGARLVRIDSGNKHNAIPREGFATIAVPNAKVADFAKYIEEFKAILNNEWLSKEPNIAFLCEAAPAPATIMPKEFQTRLVNSFYAMPHGPLRMSPDIKGLVQTSTNFAIVETRETEVFVLTSQRSSVETEKTNMFDMVKASLELGGAKVEGGDGYPAWQPNINSPLLKVTKEVYAKLYGNEPKIEAIHAGLECGLIGEKYPNMDMISFGPNLRDVHSPDEKVQISTVEKCFDFVKELLKHIPTK